MVGERIKKSCTCEVGGALSPMCLLKGGPVVYNGLVGPSSEDTADWQCSSSRPKGWDKYTVRF